MVSIQELQQPPSNIDAEKWVISSILLDNEAFYIVDSLYLLPEDFYYNENKYIFEAMRQLRDERKNIDVVTVSDLLNKNKLLEKVWWSNYLYDISTFIVTSSFAFEYWKIVKEKAILRNILNTANKIIWDVYDQKDFNEIIDEIWKKIFELTQIKSWDSLIHIKELLSKRMENYMDIVDNPDLIQKKKVMSLYSKLDFFSWWFKPWELIILAARPSMWKTAFILNIAINASIIQKKTIVVFSLEMASEQIVDRIISTISNISFSKISKFDLSEDDFSNIWDAMQTIWDANIYIDEKASPTIPEIKAKLRKLIIEKWNIDMVVIDYLQLMRWSSWKFQTNRVQEISEISRWLKELARELNVPIIALSQLSRAVEQRPDKRPQLSDLRESWAIEQDADMVMMLYREDYYDPDTDKKWIADVYIRKNRNWPTWEVQLTWEKQVMKFFDKIDDQDYEW